MKLRALSTTTLLMTIVLLFFITPFGEVHEKTSIQQKLLQKKIGDEPLYEVEELSKFYERRTGNIHWTPEQANEMIQAINTAKTRGLNPDNYHSKAIQLYGELLNGIDQQLLLSDAFLRLAHHLRNGKVKPPASWKLKRPAVNSVDLLDRALSSNNISTLLYSVEPQNLQYQIIVETLRNYREIASAGGWDQLPNGPKLSKGSIGPTVAALRRRLVVSGEYYGKAIEDTVFDDLLDQAVRRFQQSHGLTADGIVGRSTLTELNIPIQKRIQQIEVNLERIRWISDDLGERHIRINIPAFELTASVNKNAWLKMRVIVGKADWRSPVFLTSEISYLETNPYWYVPAVIAEKEIWPKVAKNKNYLARNRLKIIKRADGGTMLRQVPGPKNSLGRIKIHFENNFGCYLHDTPEKHLFDNVDRAFSHGCIRLENALKLSEYLLIGDSEWDRQKLVDAIENDLQQKIYLREPVPISIVYLTTWLDDSGVLQFRKDLYQMDRLLERQLHQN
jgi:murein L,D-transpeptidase YcbB/YkuD